MVTRSQSHLFPGSDVAEPVAHYRLHPFERFGTGAVAGAERAGIFAEAARDLFVFGEILCAVAIFPEEMEAAYHRLRKVLASELADAPVEDVQDSRMRTAGKERRFAAAADDKTLFVGKIVRHIRVRDLLHDPGIGGRQRISALFGHEKRKFVVDANIAVEKPDLRQFQQRLASELTARTPKFV